MYNMSYIQTLLYRKKVHFMDSTELEVSII